MSLGNQEQEAESQSQRRRRSILRRIEAAINVIEVEKAGAYTEFQLTEFTIYSQDKTVQSFIFHLLRILGYIWVTCISILNIPLQPPDLPWQTQYMFFLFTVFSIAASAHCAFVLYAALFPELKIPWVRTVILTMPCASTVAAVIAILASWIGFPVPFSWINASIPAVPALILPVYFASKARIKIVDEFKLRFRNFGLIVVSMIVMIVSYSTIMVTLKQITSPVLQMTIALLFPAQKFLLQYFIYRLSKHTKISELAPVICVFVPVFINSFFIAVMLQEGISILVVTQLLLIDIKTNIHFARMLWKLGEHKGNTPQAVEARLRALHIAEFVILTETVECLVPIIYGVILVRMFYGPNRAYFELFDNFSESDLFQLLQSYTVLVLIEALVLALVLLLTYRRLNLNLITLMDFVLSKYWHLVAALITTFVMVILLMKIVHNGFDFTFEFKWLKS